MLYGDGLFHLAFRYICAILVHFHMLQSILTALDYQPVKGDIMFGSQLLQRVNQRIGHPNGFIGSRWLLNAKQSAAPP